jgi:hypothetical protein
VLASRLTATPHHRGIIELTGAQVAAPKEAANGRSIHPAGRARKRGLAAVPPKRRHMTIPAPESQADLQVYDAALHREAVVRIWREVGWITSESDESLDWCVEGSRGHVAEVGGQAECFVLVTPGTMRYLAADLPLAVVSGVTTSRVARKLGLAGRLVARALAAEARGGALVAALGIFDQGFYDRLGFGPGSYVHRVSFDPAQLRVPTRARLASRLSADDWQVAHSAKLARYRTHGACNLTPPGIWRAEMAEGKGAFGLGYRDCGGTLTHYAWCSTRDVASGPYRAELVYRDGGELLELMALLGTLGDQVHLVTVREPADIQLQDLLALPFRHAAVTRQGRFEVKTTAAAYWQARILDLPGCVGATHLDTQPLGFNLELDDPIQAWADDSGWRGVGGAYVVQLGPESSASPGTDPAVPTLHASVGAFTRLWLGVRPATGLAVTDDLGAPRELLERLDAVFCLPDPQPDWDF